MVRPKLCPGCQLSTADHFFGPPGKDCEGPPERAEFQEQEQDQRQRNDIALSHENPSNSPTVHSTSSAVLSGLLDSVTVLTQEVKALRAENVEIRALVQSAPRQPPPPPNAAMTQPVTLPELRAMQELNAQVNRRVAQLQLDDSDDETLPPCVAASNSSNQVIKLKSGKEDKPTSVVVNKQLWPQRFLCVTSMGSEPTYEQLTIAQFVTGYSQLLQSDEISDLERRERQTHLVSLMYFAQQYTWDAVLAFHASVLLEIERGILKWGDSFFHLESRTLYTKPLIDSTSATTKSTLIIVCLFPLNKLCSNAILFCRDYQRGTCKHTTDHYGYIRGERKWLRHICAKCWVSTRSQEFHREGTPDCPAYVVAPKN